MAEDDFVPQVANGPFTPRDHIFCTGGSIADPGVIWFDACHPGQPRLSLGARYARARGASLPLESGEIARACEALFGPPVPKEARDFPDSADWVLTTPMKGVYLMVRLPNNPLDRFGFGIDMATREAIQEAGSSMGLEAKDAMEQQVQDALLVTLKAIRAEMLAPAPTSPLEVGAGRR